MSISAEDLPSVAVIEILSHLDWNEKLNAVSAISAWKAHLCTTAAWPEVLYLHESEENVYFVKERRTNLLICLKVYGRYMRNIQLCLSYKLGRSGLHILNAIAENCCALQLFKISQSLGGAVVWGDNVWKKSTVQAICSILRNCQNLSEAGIIAPVIDWSTPTENNIILGMIDTSVADRVTHLELTANSVIEHEGHLKLLQKFSSLKKLRVRREKINSEILMCLVRQGLQEVTIHQDEELTLAESRQFGDPFWEKVLQLCPTFKVHLVLKYIMVIKDSFPARMPLQSLVLDDLVNIVTKGVMDYLVTNYKTTLESFTYTNSYLENFESGDRRLPAALVSMVSQCAKLQTVQYGFPLSSTSILMVARARKLEKLVIPAVEVTYEFDWAVQEDWTPDFVDWLKESGRCERSLEATVSSLLGYPWRLSYEALTFDKEDGYL